MEKRAQSGYSEARDRSHLGNVGLLGKTAMRTLSHFLHAFRTKAAIAERQKLSALLKMLRAGLT